MSDLAIRVTDLSKRYRIGSSLESYQTLRESLSNSVANPFRRKSGSNGAEGKPGEIWALRDISFDVRQGEVLGIIGRNGAGKSTLLKVLSRITRPTSGEARLFGRIGSLLEVGTGFHPELTGRENIYLNGAIIGMRRLEIQRKFDEIVEFADIGPFLDTPVKRYSSGMYMRLAFSVAAHLEPEILLIDEVLAVGDAAFQKKCLGKMGEVAHEGRTVLFVSHQMDMIRGLCDSAILLSQGRILSYGNSERVVTEYNRIDNSSSVLACFEVDEDPDMSVQVLRGKLLNSAGQICNDFDVFDQVILDFEYVIHKPVTGSIVNFILKRNGTYLFVSFDTDENPEKLDYRHTGRYHSRIKLPVPLLKPGHYTITPGTGIANMNRIQQLDDVLAFNVELVSRPSTFLSYAEKRSGTIAVPIVWDTEKIG